MASGWFKSTGSPPVAGHPFSSILNPDASEFVPFPSTVNDSPQIGQTPPPFSVNQNPDDNQDSLPIATQAAVQPASRIIYKLKPITNNLQSKTNEEFRPFQIQDTASASIIQPMAPPNIPSEKIQSPQTEELPLIKETQNSNWRTSTNSRGNERYGQNNRPSSSFRGRGRDYNNYGKAYPKERTFDQDKSREAGNNKSSEFGEVDNNEKCTRRDRDHKKERENWKSKDNQNVKGNQRNNSSRDRSNKYHPRKPEDFAESRRGSIDPQRSNNDENARGYEKPYVSSNKSEKHLESHQSNPSSNQKMSAEEFDEQASPRDLPETPSVTDSITSKDETPFVQERKETNEKRKGKRKNKNTKFQKEQALITETEKYNNNGPIKAHGSKVEEKQGLERDQENRSLDNKSQGMPAEQLDRKISEDLVEETTRSTDSQENEIKTDRDKNCFRTETRKLRDPRMEREKLNKSDTAIVSNDQPLNGARNRRSEGNYKQTKINDSIKDNLEKDFDLWEKHWGKTDSFKRISEIEGDLFQQPKDYTLAHCVAEDLRMGSGIAVSFKREFKNQPDLLDQRAKQGGLAVLPDDQNKRFVYYLVTKKESSGKPTYFTLWKSLYKMREHVKENNVQKIAIPRLGCGLDRLEWDKVKSMLEHLFRDVDVEIRVCNFQQSEGEVEEKKSKTKLVIEEFPITKIDQGTLILYLATSDNEPDEIMKHLMKKFNFWPTFKSQGRKALGEIVYYDDKGQNYGLCGCIVRRTNKDQISFKSMHKCLQAINKKNKQWGSDAFAYVAFQWMDEDAYSDELINQKCITLLINILRNVDVYVCKGSIKNEGE